MSWPGSLRARIALAAVLAVAVAGAFAAAVVLAEVKRDGRNAVDRELQSRVDLVARRPFGGRGYGGGPGGAGGSGFPGGPPDGDPGLLAGSGTFTQLSFNGSVVEQRGDVPENAPPVPDEDGLATVRINGTPWRSLTVPAGPAGQVRVEVLETLAPVDDRVAHIRHIVIIVGLIALALTGLAAWFFTTLAVRPLARLRAGAARVSGAQDLEASLPDDDGPDEVRSLSRALNDMLARLRTSSEATERALEATRRFAADAGHELRTPLTGLRANLDALERNPELPADERAALLRETTAEQDRIVHLLEGLQALARGDAAESLPREEVELADLVDAAVFGARRRHPGVQIELEDEIADAAVHGWDGGLRLLVDNLLDNAAIHGRAGGRVRVGMRRDGDSLVLGVDDDGPGIDPAERDRLLEPFARGAAATASGTGLGLAIVAQQVALHDGELRLGESELGGLCVHVRLPATAAIALARR